MKFTVAILACVIAAATAQFSGGQYDPYNQFGYNKYRNNPYGYRPTYTTPAPYRTYRPVSVTPTVTVAPSAFSVTTPAPVYVSPTAAPVQYAKYSADARNAETIRAGNEINPDGSFNYFYETNNGIAAQVQGTPRDFGGNPPVVPDVFQGAFSWISPEGKTVAINYIADENGYQPSGDAIPTPPPVPEPIVRALEYLARNAVNQKK